MHARFVAPQASRADVVLKGSWGNREVKALLRRIERLRTRPQTRPIRSLDAAGRSGRS
jgi:hypothetical protein